MDRMVGTITPKKVFSLRGPSFGVPDPDSGVAPPEPMPHGVRPHTPAVSRGVCSFDIVSQGLSLLDLTCEREPASEEGAQTYQNVRLFNRYWSGGH